MPSKTIAQRTHAKKRMLERYGLSLNKQSYTVMAGSIRNQTKNSRFVDRQSNRLTRWFVRHQSQWFPVVYDSNRKTIVTVLPEDALGLIPTD